MIVRPLQGPCSQVAPVLGVGVEGGGGEVTGMLNPYVLMFYLVRCFSVAADCFLLFAAKPLY